MSCSIDLLQFFLTSLMCIELVSIFYLQNRSSARNLNSAWTWPRFIRLWLSLPSLVNNTSYWVNIGGWLVVCPSWRCWKMETKQRGPEWSTCWLGGVLDWTPWRNEGWYQVLQGWNSNPAIKENVSIEEELETFFCHSQSFSMGVSSTEKAHVRVVPSSFARSST